LKKEVPPKDFSLSNNKGRFKLLPDKLETVFKKCRFHPPTACRMGKFCPLPEPIRLQDLLNSARSRTEKNINYFIHYSFEMHCLSSSERRAGLYVGKNGTHSDLPEVIVVVVLGKGASFRVVFFAPDFLSEKMSVVTRFVKVFHEFVIS